MNKRHTNSVLELVAVSSLFSLTAGAREHHSRNISMHGSGPTATCQVFKIMVDDRPAVIQTEDRAFTRAEALVLHATGEQNDGVQGIGWDK